MPEATESQTPGQGLLFAGRAARGEVALPGGKSPAIRAALLAAQARGETTLEALPEADDVAVALEWIEQAGAAVRREGGHVSIRGLSGPPTIRGRFGARDAAAVLRMGTLFCAAGAGQAEITGSAALGRRPHAEGIRWMRELGIEIEGGGPERAELPWRLHASGIAGGKVRAAPLTTSQFVSGFLLASPSFRKQTTILLGSTPSSEFLQQTLQALGRFGVGFHKIGAEIVISPGEVRSCHWSLPPDPSLRLVFACVPAIVGGAVRLRRAALAAPDSGMRALEAAGVRMRVDGDDWIVEGRLRGGLDLDAESNPDLVPPLAAAALFAPGPSTFRSIGRLQHKESDRLGAMSDLARRVGAQATRVGDVLTLQPTAVPRAAALSSHGDHRMALAAMLVGLAVEGTTLDDAGCLAKSVGDFEALLRGALG
ncbi:MAG: hypothetical protein JNJ88_12470 [Planctomycetes bacterium]|nr:hypothetical protein [Planctomycetota bacterium]